MSRSTPVLRMTRDGARRAMIAAQGLGSGGTVGEVVARTGFVRTLGGADVYLALRARIPGMTRAQLDAAAAAGDVRVVPAVRGCIYLVAREHVALALRFAETLSRARSEKEHAKAGIQPGEIDTLAARVIETLAEPMTTDTLRRRLPAGAVRSLGAAGKKVGLSSALPPALRRLEFDGAIERRVENGRLDSERYLWQRTARSPFDGVSLPSTPAELNVRMAEVFLRGAGLGEIRELAAWAGLAQRDAKAAVDALDTVPVEIEGEEAPHFMLASERERLTGEPRPDPVALLPFEDNLVHLHGGPAVLVDREQHELTVPSWGSGRKSSTLGESRHMALRCVVAEGRIAALWEYDPASAEVVVAPLGPTRHAAEIAKAARELKAFIEDDIGHARSYSLDTDEALAERAATLRRLAENNS